ncbi:G2/mitotic-specific cyclin [Entophlyctis luteolus]|nr:G2/mitotic-specific cyclin [Entophlyctis luteolus]KAJ3356396.1 G2/mitotic-specific cyclin [Entophlyctis luteolus]
MKGARNRSTSAKKTASETAKLASKTNAAQAEVAKLKAASSANDAENITAIAPAQTKPVTRKTKSVASSTAKATVAVVPAAVVPKGRTTKSSKPLQERSTDVVADIVHQPTEVPKTMSETSTVLDVKNEDDWDDLDQEDACDPMMLSEYVVEIFEYMRGLEVAAMPNAQYMDFQKELKWAMRDILIDWLIDIHNKFRLLPETLYLAVNIIDRFLSLRVVSLVKLQLVGITSMFIAAKYEEVIAPSIKNFIYMADGGYTEEEIQKAERYVLSVLEFNLQYPSSMSFLRRCSKAENYNIQTRTLAKYLMEISLVDHRFLDALPSQVAAAGLYLARRMLEAGPWDKNLVHYSGYTEECIKPVSDLMIDYLQKPIKHEAFYKKYASKKFMKASPFVKEWIAKNCGV